MSTTAIDRRSHPLVRRLRSARDGDDRNHVFCEGAKIIDEALKSGWTVTGLYSTAATRDSADRLLAKHGVSAPITLLSDDAMAFASDLGTPPGLIALVERAAAPRPASSEAALDLVLHGLQLPQNVGAALRTAEASGVGRVWVVKGTADPFAPKALRGSSGSAFRVPVEEAPTLSDAVSRLSAAGVAAVGATAAGDIEYDAFDWCQPVALVMGSEGAGFTPAEAALLPATVRIPMSGLVESLNVTTAAAVCLFEARRQRREASHRGA